MPLDTKKGKDTASPLELAEGISPADTLLLAQWDPCWTSNLQSCNITHVCRVKPLCLGHSVGAALELLPRSLCVRPLGVLLGVLLVCWALGQTVHQRLGGYQPPGVWGLDEVALSNSLDYHVEDS